MTKAAKARIIDLRQEVNHHAYRLFAHASADATGLPKLRGHRTSPGTAAECSEWLGADVGEVIQALALPPAVLVGHSMGCRVVIEAALQAPAQTVGIVLIDGSQFAPAMETVLKQTFTRPNGFEALIRRWFEEMFTAKSDAAVVASVVERAGRLPRSIGEKLLLDMLRYDVGRLSTSLADLRVPVMALQTTYSNEQRERRPMSKGQTTPYLEMLRARIPSVRIEIIEDTGHFPQMDEIAQTNALTRQFPCRAVVEAVQTRGGQTG